VSARRSAELIAMLRAVGRGTTHLLEVWLPVLSLSPSVFLILALIAGSAEADVPPDVSECLVASRIDLTAKSNELVPVVCVKSEEPTTFVFEARLPLGTVTLSDSRFMDFAQGGTFVTVYPKRSFLPEERVKLTVRFEDGSAPENVSFWLVGHAAHGSRRVEVFRHARSADALQREAAEARAEVSQCYEENARLRSERTAPRGLMGVAWLEITEEIHSKDIFLSLKQPSDNALTVEAAKSYSRPGAVAIRIQLLNPSNEPWIAVGATLKGVTGEEVPLSLWQGSVVSPGNFSPLVVGAERSPERFNCPCVLHAWNEQRTRAITIENITFPLAEREK
jgi:uncharacterized protein (TIGR02268 family)